MPFARVLTKVENAVKVEPVGNLLKGIRRPLAERNRLAQQGMRPAISLASVYGWCYRRVSIQSR